jgi:hypothetical protein
MDTRQTFRWTTALALAGAVMGAAGCGSFSGSDGPIGTGGGGGAGGQITTAIQTVAGTGSQGFNGDGLPLKQTALYWPQDTYVDTAGRLWIIDWNNHRVRRADTPFGAAETIVGSGFIGDTRSGPANRAHLNHTTSPPTPRAGWCWPRGTTGRSSGSHRKGTSR